MSAAKQDALAAHAQWKGKIEVVSRVAVKDAADLAVAYTPGVAEPCLAIHSDVDLSYTYTRRANLVAVITDGSAVLGLGDIGPEAGMPVMEGKCALFKAFAGVDAFPLCIRSHDVDTIVQTVKLLCGSFGGINLEDIAAPRCFEIERRLKQECDIPVFHDDQHGTAVVVLAGVLNALRLTGRTLRDSRFVINGAGSAGIAIAQLLRTAGAGELVLCDKAGALHVGMDGLTPAQRQMTQVT
ncbi:MAG: NAD-dependent malic enzyme, partial [Eubacteriales bacterium]|nr:NAD-dependent malic enzyme [Eubacteriales bacterium]